MYILHTVNYIPFKSYPDNIVEVSTLILVGVAVAWLLTQIFTIQAARFVIQRAKDESRSQRDDVVKHFDDKLDSFEGRFSAAYREDMEAISADMNKIPERIKMTAMSDKGAEVRALQAYVEREGGEVEEAAELAEGKFIEENPEMMLRMALKKALDTDVSDKYRKDNPIKAMFVDMGKAGAIAKFEEIFLGTSRLPSRKRGNTTNPYGL